MKNYKKMPILLLLLTAMNLFSQSKKGYSVVWRDEFNKQSLCRDAWNQEVRQPRFVNNELQRYTDGENIKLSKGKLQLIAKNKNNEYTSARITTQSKRIFTYGIVEIKAKLPQGIGTWPALWMLGQNIDEVGWPACGELDIMEHVGKHAGFVHSTVHNPSGYGQSPYTGILEINELFSRFHIYGMEWTKEFIDFYIDHKLVYHYQPVAKNKENWPFNQPFYLIFNIAVGGDWGGPAVDNACFPTTMEVDWVRVYQKK